MRKWLFYRIVNNTVVFRRVDPSCQGGTHVTNQLPGRLCETTILVTDDHEAEIVAMVRASHWVGESAREASSELAQTILQGRWNIKAANIIVATDHDDPTDPDLHDPTNASGGGVPLGFIMKD